MVTLPTTARDDTPLTLSADLAQAGAAFNDAPRSLGGGFWNDPDSQGQIAYPGMQPAGTAALRNNINGGLVNPGRVAVGGTGVPAGGQGGNSQGGAGQSNGSGQSDPRHGHGDSDEHGGRPVPSFWNFAENKHGPKDGSRH
jgi:hypothetical protein